MNARQKAKYYKRKYERLLNMPVRFNVVNHKIETIRFERFYPAALIVPEHKAYVREAVVEDIAYYIADNIDKYVMYRTDYMPHIDKYRLIGELMVVNTR